MESESLPQRQLPQREQIAAIVQGAPEILSQNSESVNKAIVAGSVLIAKVGQGMTDELDAECNAYLVKLKNTSQIIYNRRSPLTKMFDEVKAVFTALERELDPKSATSLYAQIQAHRDKWAKQKAEEKNMADEVNRKALAKEMEGIGLRDTFNLQTQQLFVNYLHTKREELLTIYNNVTLENIDEEAAKIASFDFIYPHSAFKEMKYVNIKYTSAFTKEEAVDILVKVKTQTLFEHFQQIYKVSILAYKQQLMDKLPGKKQELDEIAISSNKDRIELLRAESDVREKDAKDDLLMLKAQEEQRITEAAEMSKEVDKAKVLFDHQAKVQIVPETTAQVREGVKITVLHPNGFLPLVSLYFQKEGVAKTVEYLETKTFGSLVTFAEKLANQDSGERIKSEFLKYDDSFKAIAKR